jgi:hypothetical protein
VAGATQGAQRATEPPKALTTSVAPLPERGWPAWPLIVALVVVVSGVLWVSPPRFLRIALGSGRAAAAIDPYVSQLPLVGTRPATVSPPRVCGKVAVVDVDQKRIDGAFHEIDPAIRPKNASEIGTVAAVSCREVTVGAWAGAAGSNGHLVRCRVELVDYASRSWLGGLTVDSDDLPAAMRRTGEYHGARPEAAIAAWISSLPRSCS